MPGGRIESVTKEFSIKVKGSLKDFSAFNDLIIASHAGAPVRIRISAERRTGCRKDVPMRDLTASPPSASGIQKQTGTIYRPGRGQDQGRSRAHQEKPAARHGHRIAYDQSIFIKNSMEQVKEHLILGSILAIIAVFVFLRNFRTTLISAVALLFRSSPPSRYENIRFHL